MSKTRSVDFKLRKKRIYKKVKENQLYKYHEIFEVSFLKIHKKNFENQFNFLRTFFEKLKNFYGNHFLLIFLKLLCFQDRFKNNGTDYLSS